MLKSIEIINFQSHENTTLELSPHLNIIIGETDSGKSSIVRALKWVVFNRPQGRSFQRLGTEFTEVKIINDNNEIKRIKKKDENIYVVNNLELKAFGTEVPSEVKEALRLSELNFQFQLDSAFLLSMSPFEITEFIGKLTKLDKISKSIKKIYSRIRENEIKIKELKYQEEEKNRELEKYNFLNEFENKLTYYENIEKTYYELKEKREKEKLLLNEIKEKIHKKRILNEKIKFKNTISVLLSLFERVKEKREKVNVKNKLKENIRYYEKKYTIIKNNEKNINLLKEYIENYEKIKKLNFLKKNLLEKIREINLLNKKIKNVIDIKQFVNDYEIKSNLIKREKEKLNKFLDLKRNIYFIENKLKETNLRLSELKLYWQKEAPDICPFCKGTGKLK